MVSMLFRTHTEYSWCKCWTMPEAPPPPPVFRTEVYIGFPFYSVIGQPVYFCISIGPYKMLAELHKSLTTPSLGATVTISNGVFAQKGLHMKGPFLSAVRSVFQCESRIMDFSDAVSAAATINDWIKDRTNG